MADMAHDEIHMKNLSLEPKASESLIRYLNETPMIIRGFLDNFMFLESAIRFITAKYVYNSLDRMHDWDICEDFQVEILKASRELLLVLDLPINAYADALAAVMIIERVSVLKLFLDSRMSCILQKKVAGFDDFDVSHVIGVVCEILKIIQLTIAQAGELFLEFTPHTSPLLKKTLLSSLGSTSHLFSDLGITSWDSFRASFYGLFDQNIENLCLEWFYDSWLRVLSGADDKCLFDVFVNVQQICFAEKRIQATIQDEQVLDGSLEWLKSVSSFKVISPWKTTCEVVFGRHFEIWEVFLEHTFIGVIKSIIESKFAELRDKLNVKEWIDSIAKAVVDDETDYPGYEANRISSLVHNVFENVLEDLLTFFESPYAYVRREALAPLFQSHCYGIMYAILLELEFQMDKSYDETMETRNFNGEPVMSRDVAVLQLLSIMRLLFAFQNYSERITMIQGSPKLWVPNSGRAGHVGGSLKEQRAGHVGDSLKEQTSPLDSSGATNRSSSNLEVLNRLTKNCLVIAHDSWIYWVVEKLSTDLSHNLMQDENLSVTAPLRGWEEKVVKQEQSAESTSQIKISLPSMPSKYITLFLKQACVEIRRAGGHVLDKVTLQSFSSSCLRKVVDIYGDFLSNKEVLDTRVSKQGGLQILLDLGFSAEMLSGGGFIEREDVFGAPKVETSYGERRDNRQRKKAISQERERIDVLINGLAQRLDLMDWLMYEPYLWENGRQWYLRHAADFEFFGST